MKLKTTGYLLCIVIFLSFFSLTGCNATKEMQQRRNLMMPHKSDLPMNSKYKEPTKRRKNKIKVKKHKPSKHRR
jgi:hypothetical protein